MPPASDSNDELFSTEGDVGLMELSAPKDAVADIVFVHGLTGNRERTWTHKSTKTFWPRELLPLDLPDVRILTYGYDADIVKAMDVASSSTLRDHGKAFTEDLAARRRRTQTVNRPLIFVAHSLGGLVCEQALLISRGSEEPHVNALLESTFAIAFMGTPHAGSDLAAWSSVLKGLSKVLKKTDHQIVSILRPGSEMLAYLQQDFHGMLHQRERQGSAPLRIYCFYEKVGVVAIGKIVEGPSAILPRYASRGIDANHMGMTKFADAGDAGYQAVSNQLWSWVADIESSQPRISLDEMRQRRERKFATMANVHASSAVYGGSIDTGGGHVIQGDVNSNRDFYMGSNAT